MTDEGRQTTPEEQIDNQQQITEVIDNKQKKKKLYIAFSQKISKSKTEYQLTETKGDTTKLYMDKKWFPEVKIHPV
ncbi:hypothetical protein J4E86_000020 [Alternaria arbusti]|uniref:uncharacterized protein n=1 Tax=Alternaria arbusti TaxID=232088 RepID=UPI002220CEAC|nr:uncharacterized protein J4E86_000020 [Alternaria arbusti]KAI4960995.1 hypothetical protein J4E86_000020 [Alternaria arbusti]